MSGLDHVETTAEYRRLVERLTHVRDDVATWSVLGDVLMAAGHPRGEFIALDRARATAVGTDRAFLERARTDLLARNREVLLGPSALLGDLLLTWHLGFIATVETPNHPIHPDCVRLLRSHPSGQLVDTLCLRADDLRHYLGQEAVYPAPVRHLVIKGPPWGQPANLEATEAELPCLRSLRVSHLAHVDLSTFDARLERLALEPPFGYVGGLSAFLTSHTVGELELSTPEFLTDVPVGRAPERVSIKAHLTGRFLAMLGTEIKRTQVTALDLFDCEIPRSDFASVAAMLQGSWRHATVKLPPAARQHDAIKRALLARRAS